MNEIKPINPIIEIHMDKKSSKKEDMKKKKSVNSKTSFVDILESLQTKNEEKKKIVANHHSILNLKPRIDFNEEIVEDNSIIYIKESGNWNKYSTVYKKENGVWVIQSDLGTIFDTNINYVKGN